MVTPTAPPKTAVPVNALLNMHARASGSFSKFVTITAAHSRMYKTAINGTSHLQNAAIFRTPPKITHAVSTTKTAVVHTGGALNTEP